MAGDGSPERSEIDALFAQVYDELRSLARAYLQDERRGHTLQPTALVNEAYLRLAPQLEACWQDRTHFYRVAAMAMRRVLVDHARSRGRRKRGGDRERRPFETGELPPVSDSAELVLLDRALSELAEQQPRKARVVELRFFGGLSVEETAENLGISPATVKREWALARAWLLREMA